MITPDGERVEKSRIYPPCERELRAGLVARLSPPCESEPRAGLVARLSPPCEGGVRGGGPRATNYSMRVGPSSINLAAPPGLPASEQQGHSRRPGFTSRRPSHRRGHRPGPGGTVHGQTLPRGAAQRQVVAQRRGSRSPARSSAFARSSKSSKTAPCSRRFWSTRPPTAAPARCARRSSIPIAPPVTARTSSTLPFPALACSRSRPLALAGHHGLGVDRWNIPAGLH